MEKYDVTALGELLVDFTMNGLSTQQNQLFEANPGGAPCNVLAMLQKLGRKTAFIGKVGNDSFGKMLKDTVSAQGVNTDNLLSRDWDLDSNRIGVWGESAGGHLVDLMGSTDDVQEFEGKGGWQGYSSHVNAVCTWYSPYQLEEMNPGEGSVFSLLLGNPTPDELP